MKSYYRYDKLNRPNRKSALIMCSIFFIELFIWEGYFEFTKESIPALLFILFPIINFVKHTIIEINYTRWVCQERLELAREAGKHGEFWYAVYSAEEMFTLYPNMMFAILEYEIMKSTNQNIVCPLIITLIIILAYLIPIWRNSFQRKTLLFSTLRIIIYDGIVYFGMIIYMTALLSMLVV